MTEIVTLHRYVVSFEDGTTYEAAAESMTKVAREIAPAFAEVFEKGEQRFEIARRSGHGPACYFVSRFNAEFQCVEFRAERGGWTLHTEKAKRMSFDEALEEHRQHDHAGVTDAFADANERAGR